MTTAAQDARIWQAMADAIPPHNGGSPALVLRAAFGAGAAAAARIAAETDPKVTHTEGWYPSVETHAWPTPDEDVTADLPEPLALARAVLLRLRRPGGAALARDTDLALLAEVLEPITRPGRPTNQQRDTLADELAAIWVRENNLFRQAERLLALGYRKVLPPEEAT